MTTREIEDRFQGAHVTGLRNKWGMPPLEQPTRMDRVANAAATVLVCALLGAGLVGAAWLVSFLGGAS